MSTQELSSKIASLSPRDLLTEVRKWIDPSTKDTCPEFGAWLSEYASDTAAAGSEALPALRVALFCLARARSHEAFADICSILESTDFQGRIQNNDWIVVNMHRILGSIATSEDAGKLEELSMDGGLTEDFREQALLAIHFMWIEGMLDASSVTEIYRRLINKFIASDDKRERMAMALALNGAVVGGSALRTEVAAILDSNALGEKTATIAQAVQTIITQTQKFREIYAKQHKGFFDKPEDEIPTIHEPVIEDIPDMPGKGKPVVRSQPKVGRNDPCPCGSGKKYKKCCGRNL